MNAREFTSWLALNPISFLVFFVALWITVCLILARFSGWSHLAETRRLTEPFTGRKWHFRSARLRRTNYSNALTFGASSEGLYLAVLPIFRAGHRPLLIPWQHVRKLPPTGMAFLSTMLEVGPEFPVRISLSKSLVESIEKELGRSL